MLADSYSAAHSQEQSLLGLTAAAEVAGDGVASAAAVLTEHLRGMAARKLASSLRCNVMLRDTVVATQIKQSSAAGGARQAQKRIRKVLVDDME